MHGVQKTMYNVKIKIYLMKNVSIKRRLYEDAQQALSVCYNIGPAGCLYQSRCERQGTIPCLIIPIIQYVAINVMCLIIMYLEQGLICGRCGCVPGFPRF